MAVIDETALMNATAQAELVEAAIERIERLNPILNTVVTTMYDEALEAAGGDIPDGPFSGFPFR
ncbi:MAG: hypothetical protein SWK76_10695 [Actinomycetota bacterium]|nr:hypothetical protein [Actinomycetota bacterium]